MKSAEFLNFFIANELAEKGKTVRHTVSDCHYGRKFRISSKYYHASLVFLATLYLFYSWMYFGPVLNQEKEKDPIMFGQYQTKTATVHNF